MSRDQYEHAPVIHAALTCTVMLCNTAIRIVNALIRHSVHKHNAHAGSGPLDFLNRPDAIEEIEEIEAP